MLDVESFLLGIAAGGGGGNPNYVETIKGTMANPWGEADYVQLVSDVASNNATVYISVPSMSLSFDAYLVVDADNTFIVSGADFSVVGDVPSLKLAARASYTSVGALSRLLMWQNGTTVDVTDQLSGAETDLTIIHHPMP